VVERRNSRKVQRNPKKKKKMGGRKGGKKEVDCLECRREARK